MQLDLSRNKSYPANHVFFGWGQSHYLVETQSFRIQCARTGAMGKDLVALLKARDEKKPKNLDVTYENSFYVLILYPLHVSTHFQRSATRLAETQESCWPCWCAQAPCFEASCCIFEGASSWPINELSTTDAGLNHASGQRIKFMGSKLVSTCLQLHSAGCHCSIKEFGAWISAAWMCWGFGDPWMQTHLLAKALPTHHK